MILETVNTRGRSSGVIATLLLGLALVGVSCAPCFASRAYADEATADSADVAGLEESLREEAVASRLKITTNQQSDDREVDFVSVCAESGDLDIEMTITYANAEPTKAHEPNYLYVRLDVDEGEGFKWLSPVVDGDSTLIYNYHLTGGKRAAFWIFDYPKDRQTETAPTLRLVATDRKGRQVYGTTVGGFRSSLESLGDGSFFLNNARVDQDAEDKAGLPNAKLVLSVLDDDEDQNPPDGTEDEGGEDGDEGGPTINWEKDKRKGTDGDTPQTGDAVVIYTLVVIVLSLVAFIVLSRRKK